MTSPPFARLAARALARAETRDSAPGAPTAAARKDAIAVLERALVARRRRNTLRRVALFGGGAATLAAAAVGLLALAARPAPAVVGAADHGSRRPTTVAPQAPAPGEETRPTNHVGVVATAVVDGTTVVGGGDHREVLEGTELPAGSRIVTPAAGSARLALSTGTRLTVAPQSELAVVEDGAVEMFRLERGAVRAEVAHLHDGERFVIGTPDAEIEVHGTVFEVRVGEPEDACGGTRTQVVVTEGVVTVRHGSMVERLSAGERWPRGCAAPRLEARRDEPRGPGERSAAPTAARRGGASGVASPMPAGPQTVSRLTEMNDAYAHAVALRQRGDVSLAIVAFDEFASDYRAGPLEESARVEHLRLLVTVDRNRARADATRYLRDFPNGFAREEAARVLE